MMDAGGSLQLCTGQHAGCEAKIGEISVHISNTLTCVRTFFLVA